MGILADIHTVPPSILLIGLGGIAGPVLVFWVLDKLFTPKEHN